MPIRIDNALCELKIKAPNELGMLVGALTEGA